jgi:hypothetical protein
VISLVFSSTKTIEQELERKKDGGKRAQKKKKARRRRIYRLKRNISKLKNLPYILSCI